MEEEFASAVRLQAVSGDAPLRGTVTAGVSFVLTESWAKRFLANCAPRHGARIANQTYWLSGLLNSRFCSAMLIASTVGTRARMPSTTIGGTTKTIGSLVPVFTATARARPHSRELGNPGQPRFPRQVWIPAFAGMTEVGISPRAETRQPLPADAPPLCRLLSRCRTSQFARFATKFFAKSFSSSAAPLMSVRVPVTSSSSSMPQWSPNVGQSGSCQKLIAVTLPASTSA